MNFSTLKRPSALIPLAMSFAALSLVLGHIAFVGVAREADEGTGAHLWQLLMAGQIPVIAFFAITATASSKASAGRIGLAGRGRARGGRTCLPPQPLGAAASAPG